MDYPDELPILEAIKRKFPGKDSKWQSWAEIFENEDVETVGDVRVLTDEVWAGLKLTGLVRSALADLRGPPASGGGAVKKDDVKVEPDKSTAAPPSRPAASTVAKPNPAVASKPAPKASPAANGGGNKCGSCACTNFTADPFKPTKCSSCFHVHGESGSGGAPGASVRPSIAVDAAKAEKEKLERERLEKEKRERQPTTAAKSPTPAPAAAPKVAAKAASKPGQCPECDCTNFSPDAFRKTKCAQCFHIHPPTEGGGAEPSESTPASPPPAVRGGRGGNMASRGGGRPTVADPPPAEEPEAEKPSTPAPAATPAVRGRGGATRGRGGRGGGVAASAPAPVVPEPKADEENHAEAEEAAKREQDEQERRRAEKDKAEKERFEQEKHEKERTQREKSEKDKREKEKTDKEKREKDKAEKAEKERLDKEQKEKEQAASSGEYKPQLWGDWEEMWDEGTQCFYYDNLVTGVTSWDKPDGWPHADVTPPGAAPFVPLATPPAQAPPSGGKDLGTCECGVPYHSELVAFCTECGVPKKPKEEAAPSKPKAEIAAPKPPAANGPKAPAKPKALPKKEDDASPKVFCSECGTPFEGPQEKFCSECGTAQPPPPKAKAVDRPIGKVQLPSTPKAPEPTAPRPPPNKKIPVSPSTLSSLEGTLAAGFGNQSKNLDLSRVGDWQPPGARNQADKPAHTSAASDSVSQAPEGKTTPVHSTLKSSIANTKKAGMLNKCPAAKKGDIVRSGWKPRYFALQADTRFLSYWAGGGAYGAPTGTINLRQAECTITDKAPMAFRLVENGKKYFYIQASTNESRDDWVASINAVIHPTN